MRPAKNATFPYLIFPPHSADDPAPQIPADHLTRFHPWFTRFVASWVQISGEKTAEWVVNAVKVDGELDQVLWMGGFFPISGERGRSLWQSLCRT